MEKRGRPRSEGAEGKSEKEKKTARGGDPSRTEYRIVFHRTVPFSFPD